MNKTILIIIVILIVIVGGYFLLRGGYQAPIAPSSKNTSALNEFIVKGSEYSFSPSSISVNAGELVKITLENVGSASHNFVIQGLGISTRTISPGQTDTVEFAVPASGTYTFTCSVPGHAIAGMLGNLMVK